MSPHAIPPEQTEGEPPIRRGRKPEPITDQAGTSHRAWLEPVRTRLFTSGLTLDDLVERSGYSKTRISELLRGAGLYPRWEITYSVIRVLGIPARPMRRLWVAAAREAQKKKDWIDGCIAEVPPSKRPDVRPLDHQGFTDTHQAPYTSYAKALLLTDERAACVVLETFDILWLCWDEALGSSNVQRFGWRLLRARVMARTPHLDNHPLLAAAAFATVAQDQAVDPAARFAQVGESLMLFDAVSRLPDNQMDVTILRYLCGMDTTAAAEVLGVPLASARSDDRHAKRTLTETLNLHDRPGGASL
ncbi:XRE family transcriptional regulator [Streptomyces fildesensis]|uniref:XRE family transcriptional regulator n=1 Tax=Streptomyces fildesensis TaxID=375757 RepID=A0ABW8CKW8_9ACTN